MHEYLHDFKYTLSQPMGPNLLPMQTASLPNRWFWWLFWQCPSDKVNCESVHEIRQLHCAPGYRYLLSRVAPLKEGLRSIWIQPPMLLFGMTGHTKIESQLEITWGAVLGGKVPSLQIRSSVRWGAPLKIRNPKPLYPKVLAMKW